MAVTGVSAVAVVPQPFKGQTSSPTKAETINENATAANAAQEANQIATERLASTRGDSRSIDKLV
jgi:Tfp pilus assembly major pilin PilA